MKNYQLIEDYFVKLHQNYGISELSYKDKRLEIDERNIKNLVFLSEDFKDEFDNLLDHCSMIYHEVGKSFSIKIRKDINNHFMVNLYRN